MLSGPLQQKRLNMVRLHLLRARGWRYLRYLHLADFVRTYSRLCNSFCSAGSGLGFAELALAIEFPDIEFYVTDIVAAGRPNYFKCMDLVMRWHVKNLRFGIWDLTQPSPRKFDLIASTEVIEHIKPPEPAMISMLEAANCATYALAPYADKVTNANAEQRLNAYLEHEHFVCGYDAEFFVNLKFNYKSIKSNGVYWAKSGAAFRKELIGLADTAIDESFDSLCKRAELDLICEAPSPGQCAGIKVVYEI
jgi:hypothetical protein